LIVGRVRERDVGNADGFENSAAPAGRVFIAGDLARFNCDRQAVLAGKRANKLRVSIALRSTPLMIQMRHVQPVTRSHKRVE